MPNVLSDRQNRSEGSISSVDGPGFPWLVYRDLEQLCVRYLDWVDPLQHSDAARSRTRLAVENFASAGGAEIQMELERLMAAGDDVQRLIPYWNDWYLADRMSLPVNSNPFYLLRLPSAEQAAQAAKLAFAACAFYLSVESGEMEPDLLKGEPLCMEQYKCMFGTARIPGLGEDAFTGLPSSQYSSDSPRHIVVIRRGSYFKIKVIDDIGRILSPSNLEHLFRDIIGNNISDPFPVGALTSLERDRWARARGLLLATEPRNRLALDDIEGSLFTLSLDESAPKSRDEAARVLLHGDPGERWFDKAIQIIVCSNGVAGLNFEHSHIDGSPMARFVRFLTGPLADPVSGVFETVPLVLEFCLSDLIREEIRAACSEHISVGKANLICSLDFESFGKELIKGLNFSPDAFIMVALQLAQQRTWGYCRSIFESVMLRSFYRGRTEAMRPISRQSIDFVEAMDNRTVSKSRKRKALLEAGSEHVRRIGQCLNGEGVEGHLQALLLLWKKNHSGSRTPDIFSDGAWHDLTRNVFSTSTTDVEG
ncbi:MAG TPA: choline/carnitine O-acyltransferase, partial [Synergistetes bacterium]|nr:choline/carnitine O-acyltransferase [Synergistota bacterium]